MQIIKRGKEPVYEIICRECGTEYRVKHKELIWRGSDNVIECVVCSSYVKVKDYDRVEK